MFDISLHEIVGNNVFAETQCKIVFYIGDFNYVNRLYTTWSIIFMTDENKNKLDLVCIKSM